MSSTRATIAGPRERSRRRRDGALVIRALIVGYFFGIRSEQRRCEEVHLNLPYRWFCRLGLDDGSVPDHSTFSKNRHAASAIVTCCGVCSSHAAALWPASRPGKTIVPQEHPDRISIGPMYCRYNGVVR